MGQGAGGLAWKIKYFPTQSQAAVRLLDSNTDLTPYTAILGGTTTNGSFTYTANTLYWQRIGDSMRVTGNIRINAVTTSPTGTYYVTLPSGYTWDANKQSDGGRGAFGASVVRVGGSGGGNNPVNWLTISAPSNALVFAPGLGTLGALSAGDEIKVDFTVPITGWTGNQNAPLLVGGVTSASAGLERIERIKIATCSTTPCTITSQSGSWVTSVTRSGAGAYAVNFAAGIFSAAPTCTCSADSPSSYLLCDTGPGSITTSVANLRTATGGASGGTTTDANIDMICMGPR